MASYDVASNVCEALPGGAGGAPANMWGCKLKSKPFFESSLSGVGFKN